MPVQDSTTLEDPELPDLTEPQEEPPKRGRGRPKSNPQPLPSHGSGPPNPPTATAAPAEDDDEPGKEFPPLSQWESPKPPPRNIHTNHHRFVDVGSIVWWYDMGSRENDPYPALVTRKIRQPISRTEHLLSLGLTIFFTRPAGKMAAIHRVEESVRHMEDPDYTGPDRESLGGWDLRPQDKRLLDLLVSHDESAKRSV